MNGCLKIGGIVVAILLVIAAGFWFLGESVRRQFLGANPVTVAQSSLESLREQNRLSTFQARYVAVVTSKQSRLGMTAQKTMIMPGMVRYEVDLSKLQQKDLRWDAGNNRLSITLPQVEVIGPAVDINNVREYDGGGLLMTLTDVESKLDDANRKAGQAELVRQAREATPMKLARDATRRAVERSFTMPLKAVGITATVDVRFADEARAPTERWDTSRSPQEVIANKW
ncbi:DUF4230 domain-containing protein [Sphingomonas sp. M1-B02]|uniref:DUF4230 domain-containing protein n=1 Tax=Sphingomonas sp. M1-B02 TaxID=3114300 RepID=UPI00224001CB|nr:DUF4230 domain-containing protein [Sphingomonas sp. S6-11]UZK66174.1 DUF4230 domain-containing protein [Sphingomonas sp. S6-11]